MLDFREAPRQIHSHRPRKSHPNLPGAPLLEKIFSQHQTSSPLLSLRHLNCLLAVLLVTFSNPSIVSPSEFPKSFCKFDRDATLTGRPLVVFVPRLGGVIAIIGALCVL